MFCFGFFIGARADAAVFTRIDIWLDRRSAKRRAKEDEATRKFHMGFQKSPDGIGITLVPPAKRIDGLAKAGLDDFRKDFDAKASVPPQANTPLTRK